MLVLLFFSPKKGLIILRSTKHAQFCFILGASDSTMKCTFTPARFYSSTSNTNGSTENRAVLVFDISKNNMKLLFSFNIDICILSNYQIRCIHSVNKIYFGHLLQAHIVLPIDPGANFIKL